MIRHLIDTKDLSNDEIMSVFKDANEYLDEAPRDILKNKLVINVFFENSTRTRTSFEVAASRMGAKVVSLDVATSSRKKGETLYDTAANLDAMSPHAIVVRHKSSGVPKILSKYVHASLINGGDGAYAHPTQALLDLFTLHRAFSGKLEGKTLAIVGDIRNSRVANSNIELLPRFGINLILVSPPHFMPNYDIEKSNRLEDVVDRLDAIISLRTQTERHDNPIYASLKDYALNYKITKKIIGNRDIKVLHPGPVHRGIDIADDVLSDERSKVLKQVRNGVAIRMAVLKKLICKD